MTTTTPPDPRPPGSPMPTLDAHCDRIIANLTRRLARRARPAAPRGEPTHDFFVLGFFRDLEPTEDENPQLA